MDLLQYFSSKIEQLQSANKYHRPNRGYFRAGLRKVLASPVWRIPMALLLSVFISVEGMAQVEHNYTVGPTNTACDSLNIAGLTAGEAIEAIRHTTFRHVQQFRLSRQSGLRGGTYYSCDQVQGMAVVRYGQKELLFLDLPKKVWDQWLGSDDPESFFLDHIQHQFRLWSE